MLEHVVPLDGAVLDLASGLGSLTRLVLERLPGVHCITVDFDRALLEIARNNLAEFAERITIIDEDLRGQNWFERIDWQPFAAVSSTGSRRPT